MTEIKSKLLEKAKQAKSVEELIALAKEEGIELSEKAAKVFFERLNKSSELSDDALDSVTGGNGGEFPSFKPCPRCGSRHVSQEKYPIINMFYIWNTCLDCGCGYELWCEI